MSWKLTGAAYVLAAVVLALHVERAAAASVVVDPVSFSLEASVCDCETIVDLQSSSGPLPQSVNASWPPPGLQGSVIGGGAGASATLFPALLVSASLSQANNDTGAPLGRAAASAEMTYFFMLVAKPGLGLGIGNVPVLMNGSSSLSATNSSNEGPVSNSVGMTVGVVNGGNIYALPTSTNGNFSSQLQIVPGVEYVVDMFANVSVEQTTGGASAAIDPMFTVVPDLAPDFDLRFSPGIQNDFTSAVPELSTWTMMVLGFAGIGFVTYRREIQMLHRAA